MDHQLGKIKPNLESAVFKKLLKAIFWMVKETLMEMLHDDVLKKHFFKRVLPARELVELLHEFTENLCTWFHADGIGLSTTFITKTMKDLKAYLIYWCSPTPMIITAFENESDTEEITKKQMERILNSRKDDKEAVDFLNNLKKKQDHDVPHKPHTEEKQNEDPLLNFFSFFKFKN